MRRTRTSRILTPLLSTAILFGACAPQQPSDVRNHAPNTQEMESQGIDLVAPIQAPSEPTDVIDIAAPLELGDEAPHIFDPSKVTSKQSLMAELTRTDGTNLHFWQNLHEEHRTDTTLETLAMYKTSFGENYADFVSDVFSAVRSLPLESQEIIFATAAPIAEQMDPQGNFYEGITREAFDEAERYTQRNNYVLADGAIETGRLAAEKAGKTTFERESVLADIALSEAIDYTERGNFILVDTPLNFAEQLAKASGSEFSTSDAREAMFDIAYDRAEGYASRGNYILVDEPRDFAQEIAPHMSEAAEQRDIKMGNIAYDRAEGYASRGNYVLVDEPRNFAKGLFDEWDHSSTPRDVALIELAYDVAERAVRAGRTYGAAEPIAFGEELAKSLDSTVDSATWTQQFDELEQHAQNQ